MFSIKIKILISIFAFCCFNGGAWAATDIWKDNAFTCTAPDGFKFPSKPETNNNPTPCDDGDMTLFNGLLCYAGNTLGCEAVKKAQTAEGRFWRSPLRAQNGNLHFENGSPFTSDYGNDKSFSPDMETGVLLWAMKTRNDPATQAALVSWFNWMSDNRPCIQTAPIFDYPCPTLQYPLRMCQTGGGCTLRNLPRYCEDQNCTMRPLDRDMDNAVYSFVIGTEPPDGIGNYNNKATQLLSLGFVLPAIIGTPYLSIPVGDKLYDASHIEGSGFPRHLTAVRSWMLVEMNHADIQRARDTLAYIAALEPQNAFFQYLNEGPTAKVKQLVKEYCPTGSLAKNSKKYEWMWEQAKTPVWTKPYTKNGESTSMLWDCMMMRELLGDASLGMDYSPEVLSVINTLLLNDEPCALSLTPTTQNVGNTGGNFTAQLTATGACNWKLQTDSAWMHLSSFTTGTGNSTIQYTASANTSINSRSGNITLWDGPDMVKYISVSQAGATDSDGDGITDNSDNCKLTANSSQLDTDGDHFGNACDADLNNDCKTNSLDLGLFKKAYGSNSGVVPSDFNDDGKVNSLDLGLFKKMYSKVPGPSGIGACN